MSFIDFLLEPDIIIEESMKNKPTWVIQTNSLDKTQATAVAVAVLAHGGRVIEATVLPFTEKIELSSADEDIGKFVVPYGSTKLTKLSGLRSWLGLFHGSAFSTVEWNLRRDDMLNQDAQVMAVDQAVPWLEALDPRQPIFIRPCSGFKDFSGGEVDASEALGWMKNKQAGNHQLSSGMMVSIAPAKNIRSETRWFVVGGKVIDGSTYRVRGQRHSGHITNPEDIAVAQQYADKWLPSECCVMDLAETDEGIKVVEFNCFNSSGFYAHDISAVVKAMNVYMREMEKRLCPQLLNVL